MSEGPEEKLLTVQEAAALIGVTEETIRTATLNGRLPFVRKRLRSWIGLADLRAYQERIQAQETK